MTRPLLDDWKAEHRAERLELARRAEDELAVLVASGPLAVACLGISLRHRLAALCYSDPLPRLLELALAEATCANCAYSEPESEAIPSKSLHCYQTANIVLPGYFCRDWERGS